MYPVPAMILHRPAQYLTVCAISASFSLSVMVEASPVVPQTTTGVDACGKLQIQQLIHDGKIDRTLLERRNERSRDAFKNGLFQRIAPFGIISL